jgi:hypothetical protein
MPSYKSANFSIVKGDAKTLEVTVKDIDGDVVNLTAATITAARFTIRTAVGGTVLLRKATSTVPGGDVTQIAITDPTNGILKVYIGNSDLITRSTCTLTTVIANNILNNEGFTLRDMDNNPYVIKFSKDAGAVSGQDVTVSITTGQTADNVATAIANALASDPYFVGVAGTASVVLTQRVPGDTTELTANSDTVSNVGFTVAAWAGGSEEPVAGTYPYEIELQDSSAKITTVLQAYVTLKDQVLDWYGN